MNAWREIAEWDWTLLGNGRVLHAVRALDDPELVEEEWSGFGTTECGRHGHLRIPGLFTRMGAMRCRACCKATGMPQGQQSPKNVDACRPLAETRMASLS